MEEDMLSGSLDFSGTRSWLAPLPCSLPSMPFKVGGWRGVWRRGGIAGVLTVEVVVEEGGGGGGGGGGGSGGGVGSVRRWSTLPTLLLEVTAGRYGGREASDLLLVSSLASLFALNCDDGKESCRRSLEEVGVVEGRAGVFVVLDESLVWLVLLPLLVLLLPFSMNVSAILLGVESASEPRVESASALVGAGFSNFSARESVVALLVLSVLSDDSSFLWLSGWLGVSSLGVCFEAGFLMDKLSFLASEGVEVMDLVGDVSLGLILSAELMRSFSFSLLLSRWWYCRGLVWTPGRVVPSGDTAVAVKVDTEDLGSFGMGGRLDTDTFLEAGPLTTPGLRPEGDLDTEGLGELEDDDFDMLPSFFVLLIVSLRPPVEGLTVNSVFLSPSFLLSVPSPLEDSFWLLSFFSMMVTASDVFPAPTLSLSTISDKLGPFLFFGGEAFALSMEKTGGLSSREAGAVWGCVLARKDEAREEEEADSPVDTLVMVRASLRPFFIFSLTDEEFEEEEEEFEDEEDEEDTFGLVTVELEDDVEEDVDEEEEEVVVVGVVVVVVVVEEVVVVVVVGEADLSCVMLGFPKLVCLGDMLGCLGLLLEGLGLLLPLGDEL
ncbi:hypothetical protein E2C01_017742 [Portunus trituberculatus]|uniref:Uncharacterized protein n=1 Tax=Portunus trituberculatus TaxID=210409 RepID=A0A5B7DTP9_PORTR|nr:hypothetical protein [Portunus trituberculatus]